ncbi:low-density lipoprotein receptor-related protein 1-like [Stylophora pistillata]|uniref:low-density lipoprotein receptor-related protein 1-like n=1 Tax=Stylophora pistillata TaxID=50429 RepID=UPI000C03FB26|nr:low-density lipoprotein receptor-related protein 1-like [Stylophora pistillata]
MMLMVVRSQDSCIADQCRNLEFGPEKAFDGKRLINHTIRTVVITVARFCENLCYMEPDCVSINLYTPADGNGNYEGELNNVTHEGHEDKLIDREKYSYHAAESDCVQNPCKNNATCQSGFTKKGYRCLCTVGFEGPLCGKDINECVRDLHKCSDDAFCIDTKGSYNCTCKDGFQGNGRDCKEVLYDLEDERKIEVVASIDLEDTVNDSATYPLAESEVSNEVNYENNERGGNLNRQRFENISSAEIDDIIYTRTETKKTKQSTKWAIRIFEESDKAKQALEQRKYKTKTSNSKSRPPKVEVVKYNPGRQSLGSSAEYRASYNLVLVSSRTRRSATVD